ncbi:Hypothetical protein, putative [Bodo saltans]|uniref:Uncharacterized protein n=1 Tax=Bodo saltans TaxID=75058 RepID=A0A0S4JFG6_BODSA|nr:Hypothetical protein, putative [Bodo saltans]|eukprot:CUG90157.1 Hypothetical protein, putative [Bodo saltans]
MGDLVDAGIDDVRERIIRRRELLHSDASSRSERQSQLLQGERELAETSLAAMQQTRTVIAAIRYGVVPSEPVHWKKFTAHQVLDYLSPRLPTQLVCSLIAVLTWSNPSKYLTNIIYPPESVHTGPNGGDVGQTTSADGGDIRSAMSSQGGAGFALHSRPSSRQSAHQSSVTIAVSHHDEDDNPLHGTSITSPGIIEFNVESKSAFSFDGNAVAVVNGAVLSTTDLLTQTRLHRVDTELHPPTLEGYGKKEWTRTHQAKKKQFSNEAAYSFMTKVAEDARKVEQFRKTAAARIKEKQSLQL